MLSCLLNGKQIYTFEHSKENLKKWADKNILLCPICKKPYEYCNGRIAIPYFRHKEKNACDYPYYESETDEHILGKKELYDWIKCQKGVSNVKLEPWMPLTKQRPDISFEYDNKQYVIEYQCTPIATEFLERHDLYQAAGINDIWVCGTEKYFSTKDKKRRLKTIGKYSGMYFDSKNKKMYTEDFSEILNRVCKFSNEYLSVGRIDLFNFNGRITFENFELQTKINQNIRIENNRNALKKIYRIIEEFCKLKPQYSISNNYISSIYFKNKTIQINHIINKYKLICNYEDEVLMDYNETTALEDLDYLCAKYLEV